MASSRSLRRDLQNVLVLIAFSFYVLLFRSPSGTQIQRWKGIVFRLPSFAFQRRRQAVPAFGFSRQ